MAAIYSDAEIAALVEHASFEQAGAWRDALRWQW